MLDNRANMGKQYQRKECPQCILGREQGVEESSQHWLDCEDYSECSYMMIRIHETKRLALASTQQESVTNVQKLL